MNKVYKFLFAALLLTACNGASEADKAQSLLNEARKSVAEKSFDRAHELIDSIRNTYPQEIDVRKQALAFVDSVELMRAKQDVQIADSIATFKEFELNDLKKEFAFEKQDKYQTTGYYVTKDYAGSKSAFNYFTEVEEGGTLLAVTINRSAGIKYDFSSVDIDFDSDVIPACPISRSLTQREQNSYEKCYKLAKCMQELTGARAVKEKNSLKVRFFEKKIEKDKDALSLE